MIRAILAMLAAIQLPPGAAVEASTPRNLDFEAGAAGEVPPEWYVAQDSRIAGYAAEVRKEGCRSGAGCVAIVAGPKADRSGAGTLLQQFDATPYREKTMWLRAWVRVEGRKGDRARVLFTVDGDKKSAEYLQRGDVRSGEWTLAEVKGKVPKDATEIHIGVTMTGKGRAWVDDVTFGPEDR